MKREFFVAVLIVLAVPTSWASQKDLSPSNVSYEMIQWPNQSFKLPKIVRFHDPDVMKSVNAQIEALAEELRCKAETDQEGNHVDVLSKVYFAKNDIFSVFVQAVYSCGPASFPDPVNLSKTFDLKTGKIISFDKLFKNYSEQKKEILSAIFSDRIEAIRTSEEGSGSCEDNNPNLTMDGLLSSEFNYTLSERHLQVEPDWSQREIKCSSAETVSYEKIIPYAAKDSLLMRAR